MRKRWRVRRALARLTLAAAVGVAGWRLGPKAFQRVSRIWWRHACAVYEEPAGTLICAEPIPSAGWPEPFIRQRPQPKPLDDFLPPEAIAPQPAWPRIPGPVLFLHERRAPGGERLIVCVRRAVLEQRTSIDIPIGYEVTLLRPAWFGGEPSFRPLLVEDPLPVHAYGESGNGDGQIRFFEGRADLKDEARFTIPFSVNGRRGELLGKLNATRLDAAEVEQGRHAVEIQLN